MSRKTAQALARATHIGYDAGGQWIKAEVFFEDGQHQPVLDPRGEAIIRNALLIRPDTGEIVFGEAAIQEGYEHPESLAVDYKGKLGDPAKQFLNGKASAKDCAAHMAAHVKQLGEQQVGQTIDKVVVTMPQNFSDPAKRDHCEAVESTGLQIIPDGEGGGGKVSEPVAAALAYGNLHGLCTANATVGIFDYGSTTLDCCILRFRDNQASVCGAEGVKQLGAFDLQVTMQKLVLERAVKGGLLSAREADNLSPLQLHDLRVECAKAVQHLSLIAQVRIPVNVGKTPGSIKISQKDFQSIILEPELQKAFACMDRALDAAKLKAEQLDYLVPVGGPCRSPYVQARLAEHCKKKPSIDIDQLRAVVIGAGLHGHWLLQRRGNAGGQSLPDVIMPKEVVPHNIGLIVSDLVEGRLVNSAQIIFAKGITAPAKVSRNYRLLYPHASACRLQFVQCPSDGAPLEACTPLAEAAFNNLPLEQVLSDRIQIDATFDSVAMVEMDALDRVSGKRVHASFSGKTI